MSDPKMLEQALDALERLMRIFQLERIIYQFAALACLILFLYAGYRLFSQEAVTTADMVLILGATGVSTACSSRVAFFLNKAFRIIEEIILKLAEIEKQP